ncbi:unnamed protein product [Colias eurytheme]|nr:unnamed protein product [Colias eurytheme]
MIYTASEYVDMILLYGECQYNTRQTVKTYAERYPKRNCPSTTTIMSVIQRLRENGPIIPKLGSYLSTSSSKLSKEERFKERVFDYFARNPTASLRMASNKLDKPPNALQRLLSESNKFKYIKKQPLQISDENMPVRKAYCEWLMSKLDRDATFTSNIIWTDESTFTFSGMINRHGTSYWKSKRGNTINVWAGICGDDIIGPIFYERDLSEMKCLKIINRSVSDFIDKRPLTEHGNFWFHLNETEEEMNKVKERLTELFEDRWIGTNGPVRWPTQSPDLSPVNFFLWELITERVYDNDHDVETMTLDKLQDKISEAFEEVQELALEGDIMTKMREDIVKRCKSCIAEDGGLF